LIRHELLVKALVARQFILVDYQKQHVTVPQPVQMFI
jgi:hypothetical protein